MLVISSSYGNDSLCLIAFLYATRHLDDYGDVYVSYCDTGWAAPGWNERVDAAEAWVKTLGMTPVRIKSMGMEELVRLKKGFPANQYQFCTAHLKGIPFLNWIDEIDPECKATVCVGKRRAESAARANTPEYVKNSEHHGGRLLWHAICEFTD